MTQQIRKHNKLIEAKAYLMDGKISLQEYEQLINELVKEKRLAK